ncbi:MAG: hypothetical protein V8S75_00910 [[Ruminococcus] torques]
MQILVNEGEVVSNDLLRGRVDGVKVGENPEGGEDVKLSGALIGLFQAGHGRIYRGKCAAYRNHGRGWQLCL